MATSTKWWTLWAIGLCLWTYSSQAQTLPETSTDALREMTEMAGVIFTGQVVAVRAQDHSGIVEVDFAVDNAIRGVTGGSYTMREWAGLWPGHDEPFRVGQRYLMLLHTQGAGGLSSPVGGMDGAIPIRAEEDASAPAGASPRYDNPGDSAMGVSGRQVDLSWVSTRAARAVAYQPSSVRGPSAGPITVHAEQVSAAATNVSGQISTAQQQAEVGAVVDMLRTWERSEYGNR